MLHIEGDVIGKNKLIARQSVNFNSQWPIKQICRLIKGAGVNVIVLLAFQGGQYPSFIGR